MKFAFKIDWDAMQRELSTRERILIQRQWIEKVWAKVRPVKFPARRRRSDREVPKAA